jgi:hypothetical protein
LHCFALACTVAASCAAYSSGNVVHMSESIGPAPEGPDGREMRPKTGAGMAGLGTRLTLTAARIEERLDAARFRLRLLRMALSPVDRIPALVIMALESPGYDDSDLLDPVARAERIGPVT